MEKIGIEMTYDSFTHQDIFARKHDMRNYHDRENFLMKAMSSSKKNIFKPKSCNYTFRLYFPCFLTGIILNKI